MSDGRLFTDYRPSCYFHDLIAKQNDIRNSYDLKMFMQERSSELRNNLLKPFHENLIFL